MENSNKPHGTFMILPGKATKKCLKDLEFTWNLTKKIL